MLHTKGAIRHTRGGGLIKVLGLVVASLRNLLMIHRSFLYLEKGENQNDVDAQKSSWGGVIVGDYPYYVQYTDTWL